MANQNEQVNMSAEFKLETQDNRTGVVTVWFKVQPPGYEWTDVYVGMSKTGEWLSGSHTFFSLNIAVRDQALTEVRSLLRKMS